MTHIPEGTLQALLDGELAPAEHESVERHLAACPACRAELAALRSAAATLRSALATLDVAARPLTPELRLAAVRRASRTRRAEGLARTLGRAALFVLAAAGVASATLLPGSPLRRWAEGLWRREAAPVAEVRPAVTAPATAPVLPAEPVSAGVGVLPVDGEVRISLEHPAPELTIRVRLADQPRAEVRGLGAAAAARFRTAPGRVTVVDAPGGELEVILPRELARASVSVDGRRVLVKQGPDVRILAPADSAGPPIIFIGHA